MNQNTQKVLLAVLVIALVGGGVAYAISRRTPVEDNNAGLNDSGTNTAEENNDRRMATTTTSTPTGQVKTATFVGKLEKIDTGCFADGECFAEVNGKHVTVLMGWSQGAVGSVIGVNGFGDLQQHIGRQVEIYAQDKGDGTYTLYGSSGFYIKLID